jgi:hypothetical protein
LKYGREMGFTGLVGRGMCTRIVSCWRSIEKRERGRGVWEYTLGIYKSGIIEYIRKG